jgi:exosortase C (VPDSG-CTERM-specific)
MNEPLETAASVPVETDRRPLATPRFPRAFIVAASLLVLAFLPALVRLIRFSFQGDLYSHVGLIPVVSLYFAWLSRKDLDLSGPPVGRIWSTVVLGIGASLALWVVAGLLGWTRLVPQDSIALSMYAFVVLLAGLGLLLLPRTSLRDLAFPFCFLVFLAPLPLAAEQALESFLQQGSAIAAHGIFVLIGTPVFRDGTYFRLPGFSMQVAPECSGINSTLALFITSIVAGRLLLRSGWARASLTFAVVPIALVRNAFRVVTIGELCVRVGPHMIDSYIHRHGGPVFFALSLIPFGAMLLWLLRCERRLPRPSASTPS